MHGRGRGIGVEHGQAISSRRGHGKGRGIGVEHGQAGNMIEERVMGFRSDETRIKSK